MLGNYRCCLGYGFVPVWWLVGVSMDGDEEVLGSTCARFWECVMVGGDDESVETERRGGKRQRGIRPTLLASTSFDDNDERNTNPKAKTKSILSYLGQWPLITTVVIFLNTISFR